MKWDRDHAAAMMNLTPCTTAAKPSNIGPPQRDAKKDGHALCIGRRSKELLIRPVLASLIPSASIEITYSRKAGHVTFLCFLSALIVASVLLGEPAPPKPPPPDAAAQKTALNLVDEIYKDDIAKAVTSAQHAELARKMLQTGIDTNDNDPAGKYVLLTKAKDLAAQANDLATALAAIDEMDKDYQIDASNENRRGGDAGKIRAVKEHFA